MSDNETDAEFLDRLESSNCYPDRLIALARKGSASKPEAGSDLVKRLQTDHVDRETMGQQTQRYKLERKEAAEVIVTLSRALANIIEIDQLEKRTTVDVDPAGCTYVVTKVDGYCADVARAALTTHLHYGRSK